MSLDPSEIQNPQSSEVFFINEPKPETKTFTQFLKILENGEGKIKTEHHNQIRKNIKLKIPEMKNIEEMKRLYHKIFLQTKLFFFFIQKKKNFSNYFRKRRKTSTMSKNNKWKFQFIVLFVWIISEYSFLKHILPEKFVKFYFLNVFFFLNINFRQNMIGSI